MFEGLAFLFAGRMFCGVLDDEQVVRGGKGLASFWCLE
jgi:hypothetical protein